MSEVIIESADDWWPVYDYSREVTQWHRENPVATFTVLADVPDELLARYDEAKARCIEVQEELEAIVVQRRRKHERTEEPDD